MVQWTYQLTKQNWLVCELGTTLLFNRSWFQNMPSGPKSYRAFRETGPRHHHWALCFSNRSPSCFQICPGRISAQNVRMMLTELKRKFAGSFVQKRHDRGDNWQSTVSNLELVLTFVFYFQLLAPFHISNCVFFEKERKKEKKIETSPGICFFFLIAQDITMFDWRTGHKFRSFVNSRLFGSILGFHLGFFGYPWVLNCMRQLKNVAPLKRNVVNEHCLS